MIQGIIFDFGGVLYKFDKATFIYKLAKFSDLGPMELYHAVYDNSDICSRYEMGKLTSLGFFTEVSTVGRLRNISFGQFIALYTEFIPVNPILALVPLLARRYTLGLLSNTSELHFEHIFKAQPLAKHFGFCTLSYQQGALKPESQIYKDSMQNLGMPAEHILYVDDSQKNLLPAEALGMQTHLLKLPYSVQFFQKLLYLR